MVCKLFLNKIIMKEWENKASHKKSKITPIADTRHRNGTSTEYKTKFEYTVITRVKLINY